MPSVNPGESEKDYVGRAIPVILKEGTTKDPKQAAAIAHSLYKRKTGKYAAFKEQKEMGPG